MNEKGINYLNQKQRELLLSENFPDVVEIMKKVRENEDIDDLDKKMIEGQLINLCGELHNARTYKLKVGTWSNESVYSDERASAARGQTIRNETIFTIVSRKKHRDWLVYIDLPVEV